MKVRRNDQWTFFEWKSAEKNGCSRPAVPRNGRNFPIIWLQTATFSTGPSWLIDFLFSDNFRDFFYSFPPVAVDGIKVETAGEVAGQDENDAGRCAKSW